MKSMLTVVSKLLLMPVQVTQYRIGLIMLVVAIVDLNTTFPKLLIAS